MHNAAAHAVESKWILLEYLIQSAYNAETPGSNHMAKANGMPESIPYTTDQAPLAIILFVCNFPNGLHHPAKHCQ
jgi:hypothetical protein